MGKRFSVIRAFGGCALVLVLVVAASSPGVSGEGYLAKTGPVPLRFQAQKPPGARLKLPPLPNDTTPPAATTNEITQTTGIGAPGASNEPPVLLTAGSDPDPFNGLNGMGMTPFPVPPGTYPTNSAAGPVPANDLLNITPQMFVEYFRPTPGMTNGAGMSVSLPVGFMPPPPPVPRDSKATYISE